MSPHTVDSRDDRVPETLLSCQPHLCSARVRKPEGGPVLGMVRMQETRMMAVRTCRRGDRWGDHVWCHTRLAGLPR